ncbi:methyl-accepting chemotaxis protein [Candidatus Magnetomorum sp. HK-1]|nr:methyl-accepting chemotaxis protein [Candidatus Magnetomorum sp. HK-1]
MFTSLKARMLTVFMGFLSFTFIFFYILLYQEIISSMNDLGLNSAKKMLSFAMLNLESKCNAIKYFEESWINQQKESIKNIVHTQNQNILTILKQVDENFSNKDAKKAIIEHLQNFRYGQNNFIWLCDINAKWLAHPNPEYVGKIFANKVDPTGKSILEPMISSAQKSGKGFYNYLSRRLNQKDFQEVYCYYEYIPKLNWVIGSSFFKDDVEKEVQKRKMALLEELRYAFNNTTIGVSGYLLLFDKRGKILAHPYLPMGTDISGTVNKASGLLLLNELIDSSENPDRPLLYLWDKATQRGEFKFWKFAYTNHYKAFDWYLTATFYKEEIQNPASHFLKKFILLSIFFCLVFIFLFVFFVNSISSPILRLASCIHEMGNNNLYATLPGYDLKRKDELGVIARGYESTRSYLSEIISEMNQHAKTVARATENFSEGAKTHFDLSEKMNAQSTVSLKCSENNLKHIELITNETDLAAKHVNTVLKSINQLSENINAVAESAAFSSTNMSSISNLVIDVSDDIYKVSESIDNMSEDLSLVFKHSTENVALSKNAEKQITSSLTSMTKLQEASENINNAVQLISAISSQTNLLALNATIEAVHAGEAGEGFAVVAEEVKVLAAKTNNANDQIRKLIVEIREYIESTVQSIHDTSQVIKTVVGNNILIGQSIESQRDISKNLSKAIESISNGARDSVQKARESDSRLKEVTFFSAEVADLSKESAESVAQTAIRIGEIAESSDVVLSGIQTSNGNIKKISKYSENITQVAKSNTRNAQELIYMTEALNHIVAIFNTCKIKDDVSGQDI